MCLFRFCQHRVSNTIEQEMRKNKNSLYINVWNTDVQKYIEVRFMYLTPEKISTLEQILQQTSFTNYSINNTIHQIVLLMEKEDLMYLQRILNNTFVCVVNNFTKF